MAITNNHRVYHGGIKWLGQWWWRSSNNGSEPTTAVVGILWWSQWLEHGASLWPCHDDGLSINVTGQYLEEEEEEGMIRNKNRYLQTKG